MWGAAEVEDDGEPFEEKMERLTGELYACFAEGKQLEKADSEEFEGVGLWQLDE